MSETAERLLHPLWNELTEPPTSPRALVCERCPVSVARHLNAVWHSRLPVTQRGPWQFAFAAHHQGTIYAVALWHNPSARTLPSHWLELRRLAVAPDAPHCTASWMLGRMRRYFAQHCPERERLISYQDAAVHTGTIYRAAGWTVGNVAAPRVRDRSKARVGTRRDYRSNANGLEPDASPKVRWELALAAHEQAGMQPFLPGQAKRPAKQGFCGGGGNRTRERFLADRRSS